jgi:hypothetical protein
MAQPHFYLPELESNIPVPKESAHWFNNERKIILGISDGILVDEGSQTRGVSSIPDIWARPLLFQSAVKVNSRHPLRARCVQEWRGLLSLLALHKIKPELAPLEVVSVKLDGETFSTALRNLVPNPVQLEKDKYYQWTDLLLIRFDGIPLGAFFPSALVYTGADYNKKLKDKPFPFKDKEGFLAPPEKKEDGLEYMGEWLYNLQIKLNTLFYSDQRNPDHLVVGNLNELIGQWLGEIRHKLGLRENDPINVRKYKVAEDAIDVRGVAPFLGEYHVYEQLLRPLRKEDGAGGIPVSDALLNASRSPGKRVVVITEKVLSGQINIWNELRPKSLGENPRAIIETFFNGPAGTRISNVNIGDEGGLWVRPELYFLSDTLLKAKGPAILNEGEEEGNVGKKYILPFKEEILAFFSPEEVRDRLNPTYREDNGTVKFAFDLPVGESSFKIEKTYKTKVTGSAEGEVQEVADIPVVEIFPNYLGENWKRYYLFQGRAESYVIRPVLREPKVAVQQREREYRYAGRDDHGFDPAVLDQRVRIYELSGDHAFPEAVQVENDRRVPLGLILIGKKEKVQGLKHKWTVGIDFGTSNTNVYKNRGSADSAERWSYNFPAYYRSLTASREGIREKILEEYFFPVRRISLPIPTTLKIYNLARKDAMVLDYFIYYPTEYNFPENVLSDIKWNGDGERKTEYFLESLLFLILIEVVSSNVEKVDLACSYPKAFSQTNINVFQREWEGVFDKLLRSDGNNPHKIVNIHSGNVADNEAKITIRKPVFKTEGIAAGEYFASELTIPNIEDRANKEIAAICLDVGGGTTDISIWYLNNIAFDASVLLAGRQIANLLQRNNRVRELLFSKKAAMALEEKKNEQGYFSARLNLVLKNEEEEIQKMLIKHANNKDIQWLRQIIALEFGALSFYAAQVCVSTNEKVGGLLTRIADDGINLHWGGNASKLINWIDFGKYNREGIASKTLNAVFFNCLHDKSLAGRAVKPRALLQLQSPGHKSEAAGGLVVMDLERSNGESSGFVAEEEDEFVMPDESGDSQKFYAGVVCGENIELTDGSRVAFFTPIANRDLFETNNRTRFRATTLERLVRFVDILNFFGIKNGLFTEDTKIVLGETEKRIIRDGVMKEFIRMQSLREGERLIEPIFVMEIKLLLEVIKSKMKD